MDNKTVLITGTSSGIGHELAKQFAELGFRVIATSRNLETIEALTSDFIHPFKLDITNDDDIENLTDFLKSEKIKIDILINNAGYGLMGPAAETSTEKYKEVFETNFFGQIKVTQAALPFIPKNKESRIVNIGSISGVLTTPFASPYCSSKAAFNSFSDALRMELRPFKIKVVSVQPGAIKSRFGKNAARETTDALKTTSMYKDYEEIIARRAEASQERATDVEVFVKKLIKAILRNKPPALFRAGKLSFIASFLKKCLPEKLLDKILTKVFGF